MHRMFAYVERDLIRWVRAPMNVISTLVMPAAWLIFVGLAMPYGTVDGSYLDFITPSILILTILSAGLSGGSSLMFDKVLGYLNKFLAMPSPRESILFGKIFFIAVRGLLQAVVILLIAIALGASINSATSYAITFVILLLFGIIIASFGTTIALYLGEHDSYAAAQAFVSMPLFFASTALMPYSSMPGWLVPIAKINPVSYAIDGARAAAEGTFPTLSLAILAILAVAMVVVCAAMFRRVTVN